jgi:hypothetical protein
MIGGCQLNGRLAPRSLFSWHPPIKRYFSSQLTSHWCISSTISKFQWTLSVPKTLKLTIMLCHMATMALRGLIVTVWSRHLVSTQRSITGLVAAAFGQYTEFYLVMASTVQIARHNIKCRACFIVWNYRLYIYYICYMHIHIEYHLFVSLSM